MERGHRLQVAVLLMNGMWSHDLASVIQAFSIPEDRYSQAPCDMHFLSCSDVVSLDHGITVDSELFSSSDLVPDMVLIPGFSYPSAVEDLLERDESGPDWVQIKSWLERVKGQGVVIGAIGSAPILLARMGFLEGVECTVHWRYAEVLCGLCPNMKPMFSRIVVHDKEHGIWTCAGGASGLDMCIGMLAAAVGHSRMREIVSNANIWSSRTLESRQDLLNPPDRHVDIDIEQGVQAVVLEVLKHLDGKWTIPSMARVANMSPRTFQRQFQRIVGEAPSRWLLSERLSAACELLEMTDLSVSQIAASVGIGDADIMRRHFSVTYGMTPLAYRRNYQVLE